MVEGVRRTGLGAVSASVRAPGHGGAGFSVPDRGDAATAQAAPLASVPSIGLETMLALQAVDDAAERDRTARRRGSALIAALSDLQRALLGHEDPALALGALSGLSADTPEAADPALNAALRAIVLRSRIEVARRHA